MCLASSQHMQDGNQQWLKGFCSTPSSLNPVPQLIIVWYTLTMSDRLASRRAISALAQDTDALLAHQAGDHNTMWLGAWSMVAAINKRLVLQPSDTAMDPALLDYDMHDLWHIYWHNAINTEPDSPKLDRLVLHIIQTREQGHEEASTSDGRRIWTDLPFLLQDMTAYWTNECAAMSSSERLSGAQFLALLAAAGTTADDAFCGISLIVLRDALETPRPLGRLTPTVRDAARQTRDLSVADLLPAANAWIITAGRKLVQLSDGERDRFSPEVGRLGELVAPSPAVAAPPIPASGTSRVVPTAEPLLQELPRHGGFSPQRWAWWLRRLEAIASLAVQQEQQEQQGLANVSEEDRGRALALFAHGMMDNMLRIAAQTSGLLGRLSRQPGALVRRRPPVRYFGPR